MARLPRLAAAGQAHLVLLSAPRTAAGGGPSPAGVEEPGSGPSFPASGQAGRQVFRDDEDRRQFLAALREAALQHGVAVHAYALLDDQVLSLATPSVAAALGGWVQALGRRYVAGFNRRHGGAGTLWAGRFRSTVVQPGELMRVATLAVDLYPVHAGTVASAEDYRWSSARHHLGLVRDPVLSVGAAYWALGNTPFEREAAYRLALDLGLSESQWRRVEDATRKGWVLGDAAFVAELGRQIDRPLAPRPRGRPRGTARRVGAPAGGA